MARESVRRARAERLQREVAMNSRETRPGELANLQLGRPRKTVAASTAAPPIR